MVQTSGVLLSRHVSETFAASSSSPQAFTQYRPLSSRHIFAQFMLMSFTFALNHGSVSAAVSLAPAFLGLQTGSWCNGALCKYILRRHPTPSPPPPPPPQRLRAPLTPTLLLETDGVWLISSLLAPAINRLASIKWMLTCGMFSYAIYMVLNFLAVSSVLNNVDGHPCGGEGGLVELNGAFACPAQFATALTGSVVAGIGAGALFVAEQLYFAKSANAYGAARGDNDGGRSARSMFAGIFATIYIVLESACVCACVCVCVCLSVSVCGWVPDVRACAAAATALMRLLLPLARARTRAACWRCAL